MKILDSWHTGAPRIPLLLVSLAGRQVRGPGHCHHHQEDSAGPVRHESALLCHLLHPDEPLGRKRGHHQGAQVRLGDSLQELVNVEVFREKFVTTFQSSLMFWIPAQAVNFLLVPAQLRVVYVASLSLLWANIFCLIKREPTQQQSPRSKC